MNMLATIVPKSDQLNADDLMGGKTITITVTKVTITGGEQPVTVHFAGDDGKPYKPGKSMRRALVNVWGPDANDYIGRSMTLYRDEAVRFGGIDVGGIRISHMSHIDSPVTMALAEKKGSKKPFRVLPLAVEKPAAPAFSLVHPNGSVIGADSVEQWEKRCRNAIGKLEGTEALVKWRDAMQPHFEALDEVDTAAVGRVQDVVKGRLETLANKPAEDEV